MRSVHPIRSKTDVGRQSSIPYHYYSSPSDNSWDPCLSFNSVTFSKSNLQVPGPRVSHKYTTVPRKTVYILQTTMPRRNRIVRRPKRKAARSQRDRSRSLSRSRRARPQKRFRSQKRRRTRRIECDIFYLINHLKGMSDLSL